MSQTKLMKCVCKSAYQDEAYSGKRLHNKANAKVAEYRCTVCGKMNKDSK